MGVKQVSKAESSASFFAARDVLALGIILDSPHNIAIRRAFHFSRGMLHFTSPPVFGLGRARGTGYLPGVGRDVDWPDCSPLLRDTRLKRLAVWPVLFLPRVH